MLLGTIFIAGGAVLIAVFGIVPEPTRSLEDLLELFRRPAFAAYFSILALVVVLSLSATHIAEFALSRKLAQAEEWEAASLLSPASNIIDLAAPAEGRRNTALQESRHIVSETTPLLPGSKSGAVQALASHHAGEPPKHLDRTRVLIAISYASFSGILSGMCLIFAKSGVQLLLLTLGGQNQFWRWESWILVLGLVIFALLQLYYLHKALILADPTLVCPSAFCFYNLSSILNGLVYFNQLALISTLDLFLVGIGIVILLCGVWVVSIQAGGGVVDVPPWSDEPEDVCDMSDSEDEDFDGTALPLHETSTPRLAGGGLAPSKFGPVPMERETRSESSIPHLTGLGAHRRPESLVLPPPHGTSPTREGTNSTLSDLPRHVARRNTTAHPLSPNLSSRFALRHRLSSTNDDLHRQAWGSSSGLSSLANAPSHSHGHLATPLSPPLNPAGFQIGLSAVSPGFAIMPMERKHRPSHTSGLTGLGLPERERHRRRTVSEGDVISSFGADLEDAPGGGVDGRDAGGNEGDSGNTGNRDAASPNGHPRSRWKQLLGVFKRD